MSSDFVGGSLTGVMLGVLIVMSVLYLTGKAPHIVTQRAIDKGYAHYDPKIQGKLVWKDENVRYVVEGE